MKNKEVVEFVRNAIKSWNEKELTAEAALFAISSVVNPVEMTRKDIEKVRQIYKKIAWFIRQVVQNESMIRFTRQQIVDFITKEEMGMSSIFIHDKNRAEISFVDGSFDSCEIVDANETQGN